MSLLSGGLTYLLLLAVDKAEEIIASRKTQNSTLSNKLRGYRRDRQPSKKN
jgi:hypothetical protein